jgi:hypothetical protein
LLTKEPSGLQHKRRNLTEKTGVEFEAFEWHRYCLGGVAARDGIWLDQLAAVYERRASSMSMPSISFVNWLSQYGAACGSSLLAVR